MIHPFKTRREEIRLAVGLAPRVLREKARGTPDG
jgi:hypothetical protein